MRVYGTLQSSPVLEKLAISCVNIGDLEDFEQLATGADLLIANSHADTISQRLQIPLYRQGIPICDGLRPTVGHRVGNAMLTKVGYQGTMQTLFAIANLLPTP